MRTAVVAAALGRTARLCARSGAGAAAGEGSTGEREGGGGGGACGPVVVTEDAVLAWELHLLEALGFDLIVHHAHRPLLE